MINNFNDKPKLTFLQEMGRSRELETSLCWEMIIQTLMMSVGTF